VGALECKEKRPKKFSRNIANDSNEVQVQMMEMDRKEVVYVYEK